MLKSLLTTTALGVALTATTLSAKTILVNPHDSALKDDTPITISGTVVSAEDDGVTLKYGKMGSIFIELDDLAWNDESPFVKTGEKITVYGEIDDDLFSSRKIEAESVFAHDSSTYYFSSDEVEKTSFSNPYYYYTPAKVSLNDIPDDTQVSVKGTVAEVNGDEFVLRQGQNQITVDTDEMERSPMDADNAKRLQRGDVVYVSGNMDKDFFEAKEIDASYIVIIKDTSQNS